MKLTTEQKNILIAQATGTHEVAISHSGNELWWQITDRSGLLLRLFWTLPRGTNGYEKEIGFDELPSYFTDLNACHDAAESLRGKPEFDEWLYHLEQICDPISAQITATAAQRAEAIGLTLKLWEAGE